MWKDSLFVILPFNGYTASMVFPSTGWLVAFLKNKFHLGAGAVLSARSHNSDIRELVDGIVASSSANNSPEELCGESKPKDQRLEWNRLQQLDGNYGDRKSTNSQSTHWQMLKEYFQQEQPLIRVDEAVKEVSLNCCLSERIKSNDVVPPASAAAGDPIKIKNGRIQTMRASQLLQKSQEVRARNDEIEREKQNKEKRDADEKKDKKCKEIEAYSANLRQSATSADVVRIVPDSDNKSEQPELDAESIMQGLQRLKTEAYSAPVEEWQLFCLAQVVASTVAYVWNDLEARSFQKAHETMRSHFLRTPASIGRSAWQESKIHEYKLQVLLRFELFWVWLLHHPHYLVLD